jgi:parvulin-like peptidyl-prolyl isomerase
MRRLPLFLLLVPVVLVLAACGGGGSSSSGVSNGDVAVVDGTHITRDQLDHVMATAEQSYKLQKRAFPKAGSTDYAALQNQELATLVQRAELAQKAKDMNITIAPKQIDDRLTQIKKQYFGGSDAKYRAELKRQKVSEADVRSDIESQLISEALFNKVTSSVTVNDGAAKKYYSQNLSRYTTQQSRQVRHILVKTKALADRLYAQLRGGAAFAALAKKYSQDPGSKSQGGQLTIQRGQTVPEFDKTAFSLPTGGLSKPVHTQFGWHIIQAMKPIVPKKVSPYKEVSAQIKAQLVQDKKNQLASKWFSGVEQDFAKKTKYASGFGALATGATTTTPATTTG